ncbi:MAG: TerD family protein [bacterium]|nr:TerD family protein [bacterium]
MAISLKKGSSFDLTKKQPSLQKILVGLGWDVRPGNNLDLDAVCFMLGGNKKLVTDEHFVFYNNLRSPEKSVEHTGDNRTGVGEGDDEMILVNLPLVDNRVEELLFVVTINDATIKNHNFGLLENAFMRIVNVETNEEILRYNLDVDYSNGTEVEFGKLIKDGSDWKFNAVGISTEKGLQGYVDIYA